MMALDGLMPVIGSRPGLVQWVEDVGNSQQIACISGQAGPAFGLHTLNSRARVACDELPQQRGCLADRMVGPTASPRGCGQQQQQQQCVVCRVSCVPHKLFVTQPDTSPLQVFDGVPSPYDKKKRMIIPDALRVTRLRPGRR